MDLFIGILTVSDSCFDNNAVDLSGPLLEKLAKDKFKIKQIVYKLVPDEIDKIQETLIEFSDKLQVNLIFTTGGTGFSNRDVTPEATRKVIDKEAPQLALAMSLYSFNKTKFAALSRAICGIRNKTLIVNMPGSTRAVTDCFESIYEVIPHAVQLLNNDVAEINLLHKPDNKIKRKPDHICPHKTNTGAAGDRNSPYPMISVDEALQIIFKTVCSRLLNNPPNKIISSINIPPFRASIKDGYALKSTAGKGVKEVLNYISAGDPVSTMKINNDQCFKINTGAPIPDDCDCVIQVEDTKIIESLGDLEKRVEILIETESNLDIRPIGSDMEKGEIIFDSPYYPGNVAFKSICSSVGCSTTRSEPTIGIIVTGDELVDPTITTILKSGQIFDSNTIMLKELLIQFGFTKIKCLVAKDNFQSLLEAMKLMLDECAITICTGGVSMGDKDYVKAVMKECNLNIHFGRVNMKPGKPMTFASGMYQYVFGLPGNPVSAYVTFHLFVLPALRYYNQCDPDKCSLPIISVLLLNDSLSLDPRPEYARATIISKKGILYASVTGNQISSRLKSINGADVLLHLPAKTDTQTTILRGAPLKASVLRHDFISKYE